MCECQSETGANDTVVSRVRSRTRAEVEDQQRYWDDD